MMPQVAHAPSTKWKAHAAQARAEKDLDAHEGLFVFTILVMAPVREDVRAPLTPGSVSPPARDTSFAVPWRMANASAAYISACAMGGKCTCSRRSIVRLTLLRSAYHSHCSFLDSKLHPSGMKS